MHTEAADRLESWAAHSAVKRIYRRKPGIRLTLAERRLLLVTGDLLVVNGALIAALILWNNFPFSYDAVAANAKWFITLAGVGFVVGQALDAYNPVRAASTTTIVLNSGLAGLLTSLIYLAIPWLTPAPARRFFVFGYVGLTTASLALWRILYAQAFAQPNFERRVLIVGDGATAAQLASELNAAARAERANPFRGTGYHIIGWVDHLPVEDEPTLDPAYSLVRLARREAIDEILVVETATLSTAMHDALLDCRELGIPINLLSETYARLTSRLPVDYASRDLRLVVSTEHDLYHRLYEITKRVIDVVLALVGLAVLGILAPIIAAINALTSPGPLFYRQHRVGRAGRPFVLFKFRTMRPDAETTRALWASEDDDRITPLGRSMRKMRIDEIPQCINVLRGEMSIVGPRPERPQFVGDISRVLPIYRARHAVRPGITGWAQIHYHYGDSVEDARVKLEYDLYYVQHASLALDLLIMLQTLPTMILFKGQ